MRLGCALSWLARAHSPKTTFKALVKEMVECDVRAYQLGGKRGADKAD